MRFHKFVLIVCFLLLTLAATIAAQDQQESDEDLLSTGVDVQLRTDTTTPLIGEPITFTLNVIIPTDFEIAQWPQFNDTWGEFTITEVMPQQMDISGESLVITQDFTARLWRPGDYQTPVTVVVYRNTDGGERRVEVPAVFFSVPSVLERNDLTLRPHRPPISIFYLAPWQFFLITLITIGAAYGSWRWWRQHQALRTVEQSFPMSPLQIADDYLITLLERNVDSGSIISSTADELRWYIQERSTIKATELTTDELMSEIDTKTQLSDNHLKGLQWLLEQADIIKFTGLTPNKEAALRVVDTARRWIADADLVLPQDGQVVPL